MKDFCVAIGKELISVQTYEKIRLFCSDTSGLFVLYLVPQTMSSTDPSVVCEHWTILSVLCGPPPTMFLVSLQPQSWTLL